MKLLIVISSPSGGGKTTICKKLISDPSSPIFQDVRFSISATTRKIRGDEINGKDYYFFSEEEFQNKIQNNEFLEYATVFGNLYGTLKSEITSDKHIIFDIDVAGYSQIKEKVTVLSFFLLPKSMEVLEKRIQNRGDITPEEMQKRLKEAAHEIKHANKYDFILINEDINRTFGTICDIINSSILKSGSMEQ